MSNKATSSEAVSNKTVSSKAVSNETVSSKSVSDKAVSSVDKGSSVGNSVVGNGDSNSVGGSSGVGDLGDVTINVVGVVVDGLDTAVGKVHLVGALNNTGAVVALGLAEGSARVLVSHSVGVGVGGDLSKVRGSIADSMVGNRGSVVSRGMDQGCGMGHSMAKTVSDNTMGKTVSDNAMGKTVSDNAVGKSVANDTVSEAVSGNNSVSKTVSGQELGGSRGSSQQGGDASKGLHGILCWSGMIN